MKKLHVTCRSCGAGFTAARNTARFCSTTCRTKTFKEGRNAKDASSPVISVPARPAPIHESKKGIPEETFWGFVFLHDECPSIGSGYRNVEATITGNTVRVHVPSAPWIEPSKLSVPQWSGIVSSSRLAAAG